MDEPAPSRRRTDCAIVYEGQEIPAVSGEPVAVALAAAGSRVLSRSIKYHRPRSWFCLAGHCNACLMRVGGVPNVKACRAPCSDGLAVERQNAFPSGSFDVLGAADWFFPKGMDHHTLMTSSTALNALMRRVVREVSGLGRLPDGAADLSTISQSVTKSVDVVIVGAGPAGLKAAIACARSAPRGTSILLIDEGDKPGGSLFSHPAFGTAAAEGLTKEALALNLEIQSSSAAFGWFPEDDGGTLGVDCAGTLWRLKAKRYLYANGGYDVNALFADNDRPGICAARAVGTLLLRYGVIPGKKPIVLGSGEYAGALAGALEKAGVPVERIDNREEKAISARGTSWISALDVERGGQGQEKKRKVACDLVAVVEPPAPASELARMHGAEVKFSGEGGGFGVVADANGRTRRDDVYVAGDIRGYRGIEAALAEGDKVGTAIGASFQVATASGRR